MRKSSDEAVPKTEDLAAPNKELELKFEFDQSFANRLRNAAWLRELQTGRASTRAVNATYFDTPDKALHRHGLSLRVRKERGSYTQTIKASAGEAFTRNEWDLKINRPVPDREFIYDNPEFRAQLGDRAAERFEPMFETRIRRTTRNLVSGEGTEISCDLDVGEIAGRDGSVPITELELELKSGDPAVLFEIARRLNESFPVRLVKRSKSEQGYQLIDGGKPHWYRQMPVELAEGATGEEVLVGSLTKCLEHLGANEDCVLARSHEEGVHQARVALRRMRAAFSIYKPLLPDHLRRELGGRLKWAANEFGPARDWDVFGIEVLGPVARTMPEDPGLALLAKEVVHQQDLAYARAGAMLSSAEYTGLKIDVVDFLYARPWRMSVEGEAGVQLFADGRDFAAQALNKAHGKLLKRGRHFAKMSAAERHELRIDAKKVRYAAEFFAPLYDEAKVTPFLASLKALQDDLGVQNDIEVARELVKSLTDGGGEDKARRLRHAGGLVIGWHAHAAIKREKHALKAWKGYVAAERFWD